MEKIREKIREKISWNKFIFTGKMEKDTMFEHKIKRENIALLRLLAISAIS